MTKDLRETRALLHQQLEAKWETPGHVSCV